MINELRIGNWVKAPLGEFMQVQQLGHPENPDYIFAKGQDGFGQGEFEGIPLTADILEKAGFDDCTCGGYKIGFPQFKFHIDKDKDGLHYHLVRLIHLHQLQNLYFAHHLEDLIINL